MPPAARNFLTTTGLRYNYRQTTFFFPRTSFIAFSSISTFQPPLVAVVEASPQSRGSPAHRPLFHRQSAAMATATKIQLSHLTDLGIFSHGVREDAARAASEVLQEDMNSHHLFFNDLGFHSKLFPS